MIIGKKLGFDKKTIWRNIHDKVQTRTTWEHKQPGM
jgi:hypothetical protein